MTEKGLFKKYDIKKIKMVKNPNFSPTSKTSQIINNQDRFIPSLVDVDEGSEYFVLRLDGAVKDINHLKACRIAINAYANSIESFLPELSKDLKLRYPLIS